MTLRTAGRIAAVAALSLAVSACASTPRAFSPVLRTPPVDQAAFDATFYLCADEVAAGRRESFRAGRTGSAVGGAAIGGGAALVTGASAASGAGMLSGVAAGVGMMAGLIVVAPLAVYGVSRIQRANKEDDIQTAMEACLAEDGYVIQNWRRPERGEAGPLSPTRPTPRPAVPAR